MKRQNVAEVKTRVFQDIDGFWNFNRWLSIVFGNIKRNKDLNWRTQLELNDKLNKLITQGKRLLESQHQPAINAPLFVERSCFQVWKAQALNYLEEVLPDDNQYLLSFKSNVGSNFASSVETGIRLVETISKELCSGHIKLKTPERGKIRGDDLLKVFTRFHLVARQLQKRHNGRKPFEINDEYDVQDLMHSLLRLFYDDIRIEEWTPTYAGGAARMDFLLPEIETVVEVKKTRPSMSTKDLGEQLIVDIAKYQHHSKCKSLICFIYDPEARISNPMGVQSDLSKLSNNISVDVIIRPKHM